MMLWVIIHKLIFLKGKCGRKGRKEPIHPFLSSSHYLLQTRGFPYIKQYAQVIQYTGVGFAAAYLNHSTSPPFSVSHFTLLSFIMNPIQRHHYHHHHHYLITTFSPPSNLTNHHSLQMTNIPYPLPSTSNDQFTNLPMSSHRFYLQTIRFPKNLPNPPPSIFHSLFQIFRKWRVWWKEWEFWCKSARSWELYGWWTKERRGGWYWESWREKGDWIQENED